MSPTFPTAVVLDVDGTLVDSERDGHRVAFNLAFEEVGLPDRWDVDLYGELLSITGGQNRLNAYFESRGMPEDDRQDLVPRIHARKTELFRQLILDGHVGARPGVNELLAELQDAGVRLGVATTGTRAWVQPLLEHLFGLERFESLITGDEAPDRKPDPLAHRMVMDEMGLTPSEAVALEDSRNGLLAAKAAGLPCAVVTNEYTRSQDLSEADLVLDGFGTPDAPATVVHDPRKAASGGRLDLAALRNLGG